MKPENIAERKSMKLRFVALYVVSMLLIVLILSAFWKPLPSGDSKANKRSPSNGPAAIKELILADKMLHMQLFQLQELDEKRAFLLTDSKSLKGDHALDNEIAAREEKLKEAIDSFQNRQHDLSKENVVIKNNIITFFKMAYDNRRSVAGIEQALNSKPAPDDNSSLQQTLIKFQKEADKRKTRIAELERALKKQQIDLEDNATATASPEKLRDENKFLKWAVRSQVAQIRTLTERNKSLTTQLNELNNDR